MRDLQRLAESTGNAVVSCDAQCVGVARDPSRGIIPRCLFFEADGPGDLGAIIVGLNPGSSAEEERTYYGQRGADYLSVKSYWEENVKKSNQYYLRMRQFASAVGLKGPLWWTELAKCESDAKGKPLPVSTLRACGRRFLHRELRELPSIWPIVAVGRQAFEALAYFAPERTVIGCPHPTGSFGQFGRLFTGKERSLLKEAVAAMLPRDGEAVWLTPHRP